MIPCAVAWDIDGTLVDSEPLHHRALLAASAAWGVDLSELADQAFRGVHTGDVWTILAPRFPPQLTAAEWMAAINTYYAGHVGDVAPVPGAVATIAALADRGIPQVCVSNSSRIVVDANLRALGVADRLAFSISLDDVRTGKPDPEPYRMAAAGLGLAPSRILAVEDSRSGARSARDAGLVVAGYTATGGGFDDVDHIVHRLDQVIGLTGDRGRSIASRQRG